MDMFANMIMRNEIIEKYISKNYGEVPRLRGIRFMKVEKERDYEDDEDDVFNEYVGTDTIYIHTRCGDCGLGYGDEDSNYVYCGAKDWEEKNKDKFLEHITDDFDRTYCTHYFKAVIDDEYNKIISLLKENENA